MQDDKKLLDKSAVPAPQQALHEQLKAMQCPDAELAVLQQQQQLKKNAREEKAAKVLARAAGTESASIVESSSHACVGMMLYTESHFTVSEARVEVVGKKRAAQATLQTCPTASKQTLSPATQRIRR